MKRSDRINNFNIKDIKDIDKIFIKYPFIYSVFLHGSYAIGKETPLSDIDICYLSECRLDYHLESTIAEEIRYMVKSDEIDFTSFFNFPIRFRYDIMVKGKILYLADEEKYCDTRESVIREFLDFKYYIDEYDRCFRENIINGTFFS